MRLLRLLWLVVILVIMSVVLSVSFLVGCITENKFVAKILRKILPTWGGKV